MGSIMLASKRQLSEPRGALRSQSLHPCYESTHSICDRSSIAIALAACTAEVHADALDGVLEVHSAYVSMEGGVFLLHARIEYPVSPAIRDALA